MEAFTQSIPSVSKDSETLHHTLAQMSHLSVQMGQALNNLPSDPEQILESAEQLRGMHHQLMGAKEHLVSLYEQMRAEKNRS